MNIHPIPLSLQVEIINKCNLKCFYCYNSADINKQGSMDLDKFLTILQQAEDLGFFNIVLSGGEPLLHENIKQILGACTTRGFNIILNTNGVSFTLDFIQYLKKMSISQININLDGPNNVIYGKMRGKNLFSTVLGNINLLIKNGFGDKLLIGTVLSMDNYIYIEEIMHLLCVLNLRRYKIIPFIDIGRGSSATTKQIPESELIYFANKYCEIAKDLGISIDFAHSFKFFLNATKNHVSHNTAPICEAGKLAVVINSVGDVYPCPFLMVSEFYLGNVFKSSLSDIWYDSFILHKLRYRHMRDKICYSCSKYPSCLGGCIAWNFNKGLPLEVRDTRCREEKE